MQLWPLISPVFSQNRSFFGFGAEFPLMTSQERNPFGLLKVGRTIPGHLWKLLGRKTSISTDHWSYPGRRKGFYKRISGRGSKDRTFCHLPHTDCAHSLQEGWFLLPTNLCSAACTCVIHFHHLYLCQNIDRYPCWCIPRWRDQQTQTGGEASFFFNSAFWRSWHASSFIYSLLYWL